MDILDHPGKRLSPQIAVELRQFAHEAETSGDLHPRQLELLRRNGWFRMFIPKSFGGLGLTLPEVVRLEEALAWADGSTAWVATLCGGAGWFIGFVHPTVADEFFTGNGICVAGSGAVGGTAEIVQDGYVINGSWPFASGSLHATAFTANCAVYERGKPIFNPDGSERILPFVLKPSDVVIKKTWAASGMVATGSHSFSVSDVRVPGERSFELLPSHARLNDPVYQYPFLQLAETTLAANISGMTIRLLELAAESVATDHRSYHQQEVINDHIAQLNNLRSGFFSNLDASWQQLISTREIHDSVLTELSRHSHEIARICRSAVDMLDAINVHESNNNESDRVRRNIATALSHALFRKRLEEEQNV